MTRHPAQSRRQVPWGVALAASLLATLAACGGDPPPPPPPPVPVFTAQSGYPRISSEIVAWYLGRHPAQATWIGEHEHDRTLATVFPADLQRAALDANGLLTRLADVNRPTLERADYLDYRLLEYGLRAELLELGTLAVWQRDPGAYVDALGSALLALYESELAADAKLQGVAARLGQAPLLFRAARQNLDAARVPPMLARAAIEDARRTARQLTAGDSPPGAQNATAATRASWDAARGVAAASIDSFATWLEQDVLPSARGEFRLGSAALRDVLLYRRHVDTPLPQLDSLNRRAIADYREWLDRVAMDTDPLRQPEAVVESLLEDNPEAAYVLPATDAHTGLADALVRRVLPPRGLREALIQFEDLRALESEATSNEWRLIGIRRALHAHALLHAMLQMHAAGATIDEAAQDIATIGMLPFGRAREEAERLVHDPEHALIALDRMRLFALRDRMRAERGGAFDQRAFLREIEQLQLPLTLAAEAMLGREPGRLLVVGARTPGVPEPPRVLD